MFYINFQEKARELKIVTLYTEKAGVGKFRKCGFIRFCSSRVTRNWPLFGLGALNEEQLHRFLREPCSRRGFAPTELWSAT